MKMRLAAMVIFAVASLPGVVSANTPGEADLEAAIGAADDYRYQEAFQLFIKSAQEGNLVAQRSAGLMAFAGDRLYGSEIPRNDFIARQWLTAAAKQGCKVSQRVIRQLSQQSAAAN